MFQLLVRVFRELARSFFFLVKVVWFVLKRVLFCHGVWAAAVWAKERYPALQTFLDTTRELMPELVLVNVSFVSSLRNAVRLTVNQASCVALYNGTIFPMLAEFFRFFIIFAMAKGSSLLTHVQDLVVCI